jgi:uncharacterized peroxidase-related enzyme
MALGDPALVQSVLADWRTAPINEKLRATLGFLEKLTLEPERVTTTDVAELRAVSVSDEAIENAIHVCALFNIYDRVADALGFAVPGTTDFDRSAISLLRRGYA